MINLKHYCINDENKILKKKIRYSYSFKYFEPNLEIIKFYKTWPSYNKMLNEIIHLNEKADRHKILQSEDLNSCLRYISFNVDNKNVLNIQAHFRSQNQYMREYDKHFLCMISKNYINSDKVKSIKFNIIVDEYLICKL